jgi:hypothetical protein
VLSLPTIREKIEDYRAIAHNHEQEKQKKGLASCQPQKPNSGCRSDGGGYTELQSKRSFSVS